MIKFIRKMIKHIVYSIPPLKHLHQRWYWLVRKPRILQKRKTLLRFDVHLAEHCNLRCIGCEHFSPLAKEEFLDIDSFKKDCIRLSELTNKDLEEMFLLGGEPLLNSVCL
jgi:hypothetical protein